MIERSLRLSLWLAAALGLAFTLTPAVRGLNEPVSPGSVEAAILDQATRFASDQAPYLDSSATPLMPGMPFIVSGFVRLLDPYAWEPRIVGLLALLGAAAIALLVVRAETGSLTLGGSSAGLILMGQLLVVGSAAAARPEPLMLLFVLGGCAALRFLPSLAGTLLAALALSAACFTHPAGLWFAFAAIFHLASFDRRRCVIYAIALAVMVTGGHIGLTMALGPWFNDGAWDSALRALRFDPPGLLRFVGAQLLGTLGVLTLSTLLAFALPIRPWRGAVGLWTWMGFAALGAGLAATQSAAAGADAIGPAMILLAILGPVSIQRVTRHLSAWPGSTRLGGRGAVLAALLLQFLALVSRASFGS